MATEIASTSGPTWPPGVRLPVVLTFEHQSGEGAPLLPGDRPNYMVGGAMQYGGRRGIWNVLELLDRLAVTATFMICGTTAEKYPDAVRAAYAAGHEIAGMSYAFDRVRTASPEREQAIVRRTVKVLEDICGARIKGWRCPDYRVSPQTLDILSQEGFAWDSSLLNDDLPCLFDCAGGRLIEIPFTTSTADKTFIGYPYPMRGGPDGLGNVWNSEFDVLYRESERAPRFMILSIQTWATGRPAPLRTLKHFLERLKGHNDIHFARCAEIAAWCGGTQN
jgi:peptidoglycan/xylan/chitin deacetylase (PgdA/CDA1 family)